MDNTFGYGRAVAGAALSATPPSGPDTTPPAPPTGLTATAGNQRVDLAWNASPELDLAGYTVFRSTNGGSFVQLNPTLITNPSYADTGLVNGWTYGYYVTAQDQSQNVSAPSATVYAVPNEPPPFVQLFADGFESGDLAAGGWVRQNSHAFASTSSAYSGSWGARLRRTTWLERSLSTAGVQDVVVSYARRTSNLTSSQWLYVEWWNGSAWTQIEATQDTSFPSGQLRPPHGSRQQRPVQAALPDQQQQQRSERRRRPSQGHWHSDALIIARSD